MRISLIIAILVSAFSLPAHAQFGGKKFRFQASADTNAVIPPYFTNRDFVPVNVVAAAGGDLSWFPGRVVFKDGAGDWVFLPVLTKGQPAWTVIVKAVPYSFHSNINRDYKGSFKVPVIDVSASMTNAYDYEIRDVATINVPDENVPDKTAVEAQMAAFSIPASTPVYWIASVTLTTVSVKSAAEVKSGGTITGVGFSTGASTYNASSAASFTPLVCMGTIPMNEAAINKTLSATTPIAAAKPSTKPATGSALMKKLSAPFILEDKDEAAFKKLYAAKLNPDGGVVSNVRSMAQ